MEHIRNRRERYAPPIRPHSPLLHGYGHPGFHVAGSAGALALLAFGLAVTWDDAQAFLRRLNQLDPSARYRLPTELEWEYAARAGAVEQPSWAAIREQAHIQQTEKGSPRRVGQKQPNAWGLYDTLRNVWEWVEDYYNGKLFPDPAPPRTGTVRVLRGGGFLSDVKNATYFTHAGGPGNGWDVGFRVVREIR